MFSSKLSCGPYRLQGRTHIHTNVSPAHNNARYYSRSPLAKQKYKATRSSIKWPAADKNAYKGFLLSWHSPPIQHAIGLPGFSA